ncbi:hypothetical protein Lesp02_55120 [Lentzea sp. NBRC 105346]|uniref:hypothetical protein n=1 Tax=Lentzea sp. NBRC 105346 TaxID=3032205 RepID=UPI00249FA37F|nr:hypothetical protein [Lentzea sp. NBRC 105346]GLZ33324.1 hypothetical protein Lesp02_55120 [Lentzea sp. NBRC 105346]
MSDEQPPAPEWGAQQPKPASPWTARKTIAAVAIAVGITAAGGVAIYAASNSSAATGGNGPGGMGGPPGQDGGVVMRGGPLADVPHGLFQTGEVTEVSSSSLSVKSTDGYTKTYVIDSSTVMQDVQKGSTVTVIASEANGTATAESVMDSAQRGRRDGQPPQAPPTR